MDPKHTEIIAVVPAILGESHLRDTLMPACAFASRLGLEAECLYLTGDEITAAENAVFNTMTHSVSVIKVGSDTDQSQQVEYLAELAACFLCDQPLDGTTRIVFCPPGDEGEDLCARLAARVGGNAIGRCDAIGVREDGIECKRAGWGGRLTKSLIVPDNSGDIFLCQRLTGKVTEKNTTAEVKHFPLGRGMEDITEVWTAREYRATDETLPPIESAKALVSGGRSVNQAGFDQLRRLAEYLGGSLAGSLPAVDNGMVNAHRQVGVSGKFVRPAVYLAVGISGTPQHLAGVSEETTIFAINSDPEAPIFNVATAGVVGDWQAVLPALLSEFENQG